MASEILFVGTPIAKDTSYRMPKHTIFIEWLNHYRNVFIKFSNCVIGDDHSKDV